MWYNIRARGEVSKTGGRDTVVALEKIFEKLFKNPLTNTTKYGII
jgi:hypothetical protein